MNTDHRFSHCRIMNFTGRGNQTRTTKVRCTAAWASEIHDEMLYLSVFNIFLSITVVLGNILILVALRKVSSLHSPSKLLFRCLASTDLCVGLITEPLGVVYRMSLTHGQWNLCRYVLVSSIIAGYNLSSVSLLTTSAISVHRLLALLLGLRYRQVVTLKRTYVIVGMIWFISTVASISYLLNRAISFWFSLILISLCLVTSIASYTKIFLKLRHPQIHVQGHAQLEQPGQMNLLNTERYRKQGHPTDRFGKSSVRKTFNPFWFSWDNCHLELSWYEKFNVCCFRIVKIVIFGTEKRSTMIFGKARRPKVFGTGQKNP